MKCKQCGGPLVVYAEMLYTTLIPLDSDGELEWERARPIHDATDALEPESPNHSVECAKCGAKSPHNGHIWFMGAVTNISGNTNA